MGRRKQDKTIEIDENVQKHPPTVYDWDKIKVLYLRGDELKTIVKKLPELQITEKEILDKMRKDGITAKKKEINRIALDNMVSEVVADRENNSKNCVKAYKSGLDIIQTLLGDYKREQAEGGIPKRCTAYNMDLLMAGINKIQKGFDIAFGEDKNGKLYEKEPDIIVIEGIDEKKL